MKRLAAVLAVLGVLVLTAFGLGRLWLQSSLPPMGGRERVAGLGDSVTILLDSLAVPHVLAASDADAYAALGYLHARPHVPVGAAPPRGARPAVRAFGARTVGADRDLRALEMGPIARARAARMSTASLARRD
jgi:penicillin amidase